MLANTKANHKVYHFPSFFGHYNWCVHFDAQDRYLGKLPFQQCPSAPIAHRARIREKAPPYAAHILKTIRRVCNERNDKTRPAQEPMAKKRRNNSMSSPELGDSWDGKEDRGEWDVEEEQKEARGDGNDDISSSLGD